MNLNSGRVWRSFDQTHTRPGISSVPRLRDEEPPPLLILLLLLLLLMLMELTIDACDEYDMPNDDDDDDDDEEEEEEEEDDVLEP